MSWRVGFVIKLWTHWAEDSYSIFKWSCPVGGIYVSVEFREWSWLEIRFWSPQHIDGI